MFLVWYMTMAELLVFGRLYPIFITGSEEESDASEDEEDMLFLGIPRVIRSTMETPLDEDDAADDEGAGGDLASAEESAPGGDSSLDVPHTATHQPWSLYDFNWKEFSDSPVSPESRRETFFQNNVGPTIPRVDPYDIFIDIWDRPIMEHIALETNKYAQQVAAQMMETNTLKPTSRISRWVDTSVDELYVFFAIILAMGVVVNTRLEEYWTATVDIFQTPGFSVHMSIDRFKLLSKCIHFNDNDMFTLELDDSEAKLFKIKPIVDHLNYKFQVLYTPTQNIALDESLLMWKGWLQMSQMIPNKAARRGLKTYEVCESQTGYLWRFEIHSHKRPPHLQNVDDPVAAPVPSIVLRLVQGLEHKGYTLWMDNYYNSPSLARRLKTLGFDCVGTLRTDRKFVPQALHSLTKRNMRTGQVAGLSSGDLDVIVWKDVNRVSMISTYHGNAQRTIRGSTKPVLILDYNIMMGGVDKKDQLLAMYPVERKRTRVWYKKFFKRLLNISILNSYVIHRKSSPSLQSTSFSHRQFRIKLIKSILSKHFTPSNPIPLGPAQYQSVDITHRLDQYPMRGRQRMRRWCTVCKKQTNTYCVGCNKTACLGSCFVNIHS